VNEETGAVQLKKPPVSILLEKISDARCQRFKTIHKMPGLTRISVDEGRLIIRLNLAGKKYSLIATRINEHRTESYYCTSSCHS
jgi:hypothetical protein